MSDVISPKPFEVQLVKITSTVPPTTVVNIYRPPHLSRTAFFEELADLIALIGADSNANILLCGDMNCPGSDCNRADVTILFDSFGLNQHVNTLTRGDNRLDVLAAEDRVAVSGVAVDDMGLISDHRMVYAKLRSPSPPCKPTSYTYRNIRRIDTAAFEDALLRSALFTAPASFTDAFANQMVDIVSAEREKVAPLHTAIRRLPKSITRWLSPTASSAKRNGVDWKLFESEVALSRIVSLIDISVERPTRSSTRLVATTTANTSTPAPTLNLAGRL